MIKLGGGCGRKRDESRNNFVGFGVIRDLERGTVLGSGMAGQAASRDGIW
jgi:hypothetical protein